MVKYNSSSGYYNDICYIDTSDSGLDITLKDRKSEFIDNNNTLCQESCLLLEYDYNINKAKCSCDVKESSSKFENIKIDKAKLYENFIDIKNIANINLLVCYKVLFSKKGLMKNYGSYSIIVIIIAHFIIILIYYSKNLYSQIQNIMNKIAFDLYNFEFLKLPTKENKNNERLQKVRYKNKYKKKKKQKAENKNNEKAKNIKINKGEVRENSKKNPPIKKNRKIRTKIPNENNMNYKIQSEENTRYSKKNLIFNNNCNFTMKDTKINQLKQIKSYNDEELNNLEYKFALKYDNRKYCQYYLSLVKTKHALIFTFFNNTDYNLKIIKIYLINIKT